MYNLDWLTIEDLKKIFEKANYVADDNILFSVYLALKLKKPLLIEGEPGCGKTEIAKVLSQGLNTELIRLQCYEGLTASETIYEWDYMRQLIEIKIRENSKNQEELENYIFSERFLLKRPLLKAILHEGQIPPVLLIDEIDRADEEFEGFLLEFLAEFQVTIPEIGTFKAKQEPIVIITSNRTRELGDGLRRRCLYLYIGYPSYEKELKIIKLKVPNLNERVAEQIVRVVSRIRQMDNILKKPGISETLDFSRAINEARIEKLDSSNIKMFLGCLAKNPDDFSTLAKIDFNSLLS
ncbi:MAG: MoxR family ATPase [Thermoproteota archaeon]|nr:MoxR family ATPase [Thermoproteota archaeon]